MTRVWKALVAGNVVLTSAAILLCVTLFVRVSDQQDSIQSSRVTLTFQACHEQNGRHDKTFKKLDALIGEIKDPVQRKRAERNIAGTKALLNALAPHQNCKALVRRRFPS